MFRMKKYLVILTICVLSTQGAFAQEWPLKDFMEKNPNAKLPPFSKACLYPSTLRMIDLSQNPDYQDLISEIDKILVYLPDSAFLEATDSEVLFEEYKNRGFKELVSVRTNVESILVLGKGTDQVIGTLGGGDFGRPLFFYIKGSLQLQKIPRLFETFKGSDMIDVFSFRRNID